VAFGLMVALTVLFGLFAAGYAFEDPGGWQAWGWVAAVTAPMLLLTFVAYRWPSAATWLLGGLAALVLVLAVLDSTGEAGREVIRALGPVAGVTMLTFGLPMATLGLRRPLAGGLLLTGTALASYLPYVPFVLREGISLGASLTWSSTVLVVPFLVIGLLLLVAAFVQRRGTHAPPAPTAPQPMVGAGV
jgi:hypothetical protein